MKPPKLPATLFVAALALAVSGGSSAETSEVRVAYQYGISYLPLMVMQNEKLIEKHAKQAGLGEIRARWTRFTGGADMNDALLSGNLDFASGGVAPLIKIWAATHGTLDVKGVCAMNAMPLYLTTRNPNVKSLKDFTPKDKIALPAVKVSIQAVTLQMAAEQAFGPDGVHKLDSLTVTMSHPDGMQALLSGVSEITAHFTSPPFQYQELQDPRVHRVLNSYEVLGGPATFNTIWTTAKFRRDNPKTYKAFLDAFREAVEWINTHKPQAAEDYIKYANSKLPVDFIYKMLTDPEIKFTLTPENTMKYADFLYKTGAIKVKPSGWKDLFFPEIQDLPGS